MSRSDANRIALKAAAAILDAAEPFTIEVNRCTISVSPAARLPTPPWPRRHMPGIMEASDGPWPSPSVLECKWDGGSCLLQLTATSWRPPSHEEHRVSLGVSARETRKELVWITLAQQIQNARDGEEAQLYANPVISARNEEYVGIRNQLNQRIRQLVLESGLPLLSPGRIDAFRVMIPSGDVLPKPTEAFRRLVHLALIKLPFFDRGKHRAVRGRPFINVDEVIREVNAAPPVAPSEEYRRPSSHKQRVIGPLPGGYRNYKNSLDRIISYIDQEAPLPVDRFYRFLGEEMEFPDVSRQRRALKLLEQLGLVELHDEGIELSQTGQNYLGEPYETDLFRLLHHAYEGVLATLVLAARPAGAGTEDTRQLLASLSDSFGFTDQQADRRRDWLVSLGFTERMGGIDRTTAKGRTLLSDYSAEVDELFTRLESLEAPVDAVEAGMDDEDEADDEEEAAGSLTVPAPVKPPNWADDRLDLRADVVRPYVERLQLQDGLLERLCAALSTGKHLLLVGPPGTGKTELSHALAHAAAQQGYCAGLLPVTASADWTTTETIGCYAMQRDGSLSFLPGAFLRAIELHRWLLIDEFNRADVDKAFGDLMTVLSGKGTDTSFALDDGRRVSMGPEPHHTHHVPGTFRLLATMNTWDKTSLSRLSYAVQRRFAVVHIGVPDPARYSALLAHAATSERFDPRLDDGTVAQIRHLFSPEGLLKYRAIGPAVPLDMIQYMRRRQSSQGDGLAEAMAMYLLPQLEGLATAAAESTWRVLRATLEGWASATGIEELQALYAELFPHVDLSE